MVAYKGTAPALTDLMSGQIQLLADPMLSSLPLAQGGKIKALGLTSSKRAPAAPEIPTIAESGMQGFDFVSWYGLWGPKNLPANVSQTLQADIGKVLAWPEMKERLNQLGFEPIGIDFRAIREIYPQRDGEGREDHQGRQHQGGVIWRRAISAGPALALRESAARG